MEKSKTPKSSITHKSNQAQDFLNQKEDSTTQKSKSSLKSDRSLGIWKEWKTLLLKFSGWTGINLLSNELDYFLSPSLLIIGLLALLICLRAYLNTLTILRQIPVVPSICEFVGALWLIRFSITHLLRKQDRNEFIAEASKRWRAFSSQSEGNS